MAPFFTGITRAIGGAGFGKRAGGVAVPFIPITATGGTVSTPGDGYRYHVFTTPDSLSVSNAGSAGSLEVVLIGGGGGGGNGGDSYAGGGGSGGLVYCPAQPITATSYPFSIGGGGGAATSGGNTTGFSLSAVGGGSGSSRASPGIPGGSGGGGSTYTDGTTSSGSGTQPSANPGVPGIVQYGNPGAARSPAPSTLANGGSANSPNVNDANATFPNGSTIISGSPIGPQAIGRGGWNAWHLYQVGTPAWPATSYGSGGTGTLGAGTSGIVGVIIVRYPLT
jgi:hypothetical protein